MTTFFFFIDCSIAPLALDLTFGFFSFFYVHSRNQRLEEHSRKKNRGRNKSGKEITIYTYIWWTRFDVEPICRLERPVIYMRHQPSYPFYAFFCVGVYIFICWRDWQIYFEKKKKNCSSIVSWEGFFFLEGKEDMATVALCLRPTSETRC